MVSPEQGNKFLNEIYRFRTTIGKGGGRKCTSEGKDLQKGLHGTNPASAQNGGTRR